EIRAFVRQQKEAGADLIKIFASGGMLQGGMTLSQAQLNAACDEARKQGLRTLVHAYRDAVRAATLAGCTQIEHGLGASDDDLKLMAEKGTYFDPQDGLLIETYLGNKDKYLGTPFFNEETFAGLAKALPLHHELMRRAVSIPGLKIVFGTDAAPGSHGLNAEEFIHRVRDGILPMTAIVSANSVAAEALGMVDQLGAIVPGLQFHHKGNAPDGRDVFRRRSVERHHGRPARCLCDERRHRLQECRSPLNCWLWWSPALMGLLNGYFRSARTAATVSYSAAPQSGRSENGR
ncbi:MAG: hypothetical protein DMG59_18370, partial [Acidobacteria bacterium]